VTKLSRAPFPTSRPRPPRTKPTEAHLDSERFLRYVLAIVVVVAALLVGLAWAVFFVSF
jgi:hypothetical protein